MHNALPKIQANLWVTGNGKQAIFQLTMFKLCSLALFSPISKYSRKHRFVTFIEIGY